MWVEGDTDVIIDITTSDATMYGECTPGKEKFRGSQASCGPYHWPRCQLFVSSEIGGFQSSIVMSSIDLKLIRYMCSDVAPYDYYHSQANEFHDNLSIMVRASTAEDDFQMTLRYLHPLKWLYGCCVWLYLWIPVTCVPYSANYVILNTVGHTVLYRTKRNLNKAPHVWNKPNLS